MLTLHRTIYTGHLHWGHLTYSISLQEVASAIKCSVRKMWTRGLNQTPQILSCHLNTYFGVSIGLEHVNIPSSGTLHHLLQKFIKHIIFITNKTASVEWVRPRVRESPLGSRVFNKSYDVLGFLHHSFIGMWAVSGKKRCPCSMKCSARHNTTLRTPKCVLK